jgi:hypothetical protein
MADAMRKQRQVPRKIIRQWVDLPKSKRRSVDQVNAFANTAAEKNEVLSCTAVVIRARRSWDRCYRALVGDEKSLLPG